MMMSLFISFDPLITKFNPIILCLPTLMLMMVFSFNKVQFLILVAIKNYLLNEFLIATKIKTGAMLNLFFTLFIMLFMFNVFGLFPFIFTSTAHLSTTMLFGLSFWLVGIIVGSISNFNNFISHLVPSGCPLVLSQFMVLIESVSLIIRPITLSVRLGANMTAGHLLLILCSSPIIVFNSMSVALIILLVLESAVAIIQAYVFTILISMYTGENN